MAQARTATRTVEVFGASGFTRYDASLLPEFAYGKTPDVVDQIGLEELAKAGKGDVIKRPSDGKQVQSVVFVQCAGQRSEKAGHLSYCSGHCCNTSIKQALYFKNANLNIDTTIIYSDLRTPGAPGEDYYRAGQDKGVNFAKGNVSEVVPGNGALTVKFKDLILNEDVALYAASSGRCNRGRIESNSGHRKCRARSR